MNHLLSNNSWSDLDSVNYNSMRSVAVDNVANLDDIPIKTFGILSNLSSSIRPISELTDCLYICNGAHSAPDNRALILFRFGDTQAWINSRNANGWHGWKSLVQKSVMPFSDAMIESNGNIRIRIGVDENNCIHLFYRVNDGYLAVNAVKNGTQVASASKQIIKVRDS